MDAIRVVCSDRTDPGSYQTENKDKQINILSGGTFEKLNVSTQQEIDLPAYYKSLADPKVVYSTVGPSKETRAAFGDYFEKLMFWHGMKIEVRPLDPKEEFVLTARSAPLPPLLFDESGYALIVAIGRTTVHVGEISFDLSNTRDYGVFAADETDAFGTFLRRVLDKSHRKYINICGAPTVALKGFQFGKEGLLPPTHTAYRKTWATLSIENLIERCKANLGPRGKRCVAILEAVSQAC